MARGTMDLRIAEFLAARLCHDLVSPIGAIANGLEILEDEPDLAGDAGALIGLSARQASRRLQFYRVAYGSTTTLPDDLARRAAIDFFADGKITVDWRIAAIPTGWQKLACNLLLLACRAAAGSRSTAWPAGSRRTPKARAPGCRSRSRPCSPIAISRMLCRRAPSKQFLRRRWPSGRTLS